MKRIALTRATEPARGREQNVYTNLVYSRPDPSDGILISLSRCNSKVHEE